MTDRPVLLLSDSTMPVNFCKAGANSALAMLAHFEESIFLVADVFEELTRHAAESAAVKRLMEEWPASQVLDLDLALTAEVASILKLRQTVGQHPRSDAGEIATVLFAANARDQGLGEYTVVTDDVFGKDLARDRELALRTTQQVIIELVCAGSLSYRDGERVWRQCFTNRSKWSTYRPAIAASCAGRVPSEG